MSRAPSSDGPLCWSTIGGLSLIHVASVVGLVWIVVLLVTTATDRLHQGIHDRWAGSVVVQPAPGGSGAAVVGCLVMIFLAFAIPFGAVVLNGDAIRDILSQVGNSI